MVLSDQLIIRRIMEENMLKEAILHQVEAGVISCGVSCSGYDLTLDYTIKIARDGRGHGSSRKYRKYRVDEIPEDVLDPKNPNPEMFREIKLVKDEVLILYPGEYFIGNSIERFSMPDDLVGVVLGKSTYARNQIIINCTPVEAGWKGHLAIEGANIGTQPVVLYPGEGICQVLFFKVDGEILRTYAKRRGKYQYQSKTDTLSKIKRLKGR